MSHRLGHPPPPTTTMNKKVQVICASFGNSFSTRDILPRFVQESPSFGCSYSTANISPYRLSSNFQRFPAPIFDGTISSFFLPHSFVAQEMNFPLWKFVENLKTQKLTIPSALYTIKSLVTTFFLCSIRL